MKRVVWTSWDSAQADYEIAGLSGSALCHEWVNAHKVQDLRDSDVYLTGDGHSHKEGPFKKASLYAESYAYVKETYDLFADDKRWDHRFHFVPHLWTLPGCSQIRCAGWYRAEIEQMRRLQREKVEKHLFGMVLSKQTDDSPMKVAWLRDQIVSQMRGRSFAYYGEGWSSDDPNYLGYVTREFPRQLEARRLISNCKFVFAVENIHDQRYSMNYLTEKIFHAFLTCSVPVYIGCWNVEELIAPDLFVDLRSFGVSRGSPEAVSRAVDFCEKMPDEVYRGYQERIASFLCSKRGDEFTREHRYETIDRKLHDLFG